MFTSPTPETPEDIGCAVYLGVVRHLAEPGEPAELARRLAFAATMLNFWEDVLPKGVPEDWRADLYALGLTGGLTRAEVAAALATGRDQSFDLIVEVAADE